MQVGRVNMGAPAKKIADRTHLGVYSGPFFYLKMQTSGYFAVRGHLRDVLELLLEAARLLHYLNWNVDNAFSLNSQKKQGQMHFYVMHVCS
jgi:hypothetical protein